MPNPRNRRTGEQWDTCDRCGRDFPMFQLGLQKGLKVCNRCTDNLEIERRDQVIARTLSEPHTEGADTRWVQPTTTLNEEVEI